MECMEHIEHMYAPKGVLYIGIIESREGADNLNWLVVNGARDRTRARGNRQRRSDCLWPCKADTAHAPEPKVIE
jgi:hypothetical protein